MENKDERETEKEGIQKIHIGLRGISEKQRTDETRKRRVEKRRKKITPKHMEWSEIQVSE